MEKQRPCAALTLSSALGILLCSFSLFESQARRVRVAAAADLKFAMEELARDFEGKTGTKVEVSYGSSGNFFSQLQNGAPFDLFFSADVVYPRKLEAQGFVEPGTLRDYALGRIVIWMSNDSSVDLAKEGWNALLDPRIRKIAIANPELAPYGRAAASALKKAGIYKQVEAKLVYGENISQAAQFVQSGNAQAGIIARSLVFSPGMKDGKVWEIPAEMHPRIEQAAALLKNARNRSAALAFLNLVTSVSGIKILEQHGFSAPTNN